jgi:NAD(P)-dependent dehydrogenase (short-subunit alcohol dehydrogenase family)
MTSEQNTKYQLLQLENKVCIITGVASLRSIGYGTAELFAAHGAKLVILDVAMNEQIAHDLIKHLEIQIGKKTEIIVCNVI